MKYRGIIPITISVALTGYLLASNLEVVTVPDNRMTPLLQEGQEVWGINAERYKMGNIIIYHLPTKEGTTETHLSRVYGVPGDVVRVQERKVWVNGTLVRILGVATEDTRFTLTNEEYLLIDDHPESTWVRVNKRLISSRLEDYN